MEMTDVEVDGWIMPLNIKLPMEYLTKANIHIKALIKNEEDN